METLKEEYQVPLIIPTPKNILYDLQEGDLVYLRKINTSYKINEKKKLIIPSNAKSAYYIETISWVNNEVYYAILNNADKHWLGLWFFSDNFTNYDTYVFSKSIHHLYEIEYEFIKGDWKDIKKPLFDRIFYPKRDLKNYCR